jgi:hypothetical protein
VSAGVATRAVLWIWFQSPLYSGLFLSTK